MSISGFSATSPFSSWQTPQISLDDVKDGAPSNNEPPLPVNQTSTRNIHRAAKSWNLPILVDDDEPRSNSPERLVYTTAKKEEPLPPEDKVTPVYAKEPEIMPMSPIDLMHEVAPIHMEPENEEIPL